MPIPIRIKGSLSKLSEPDGTFVKPIKTTNTNIRRKDACDMFALPIQKIPEPIR